MDSLPNELIIEIFNHIQKITDKRQFLKTCIQYNKLTKQSMLNYESNYKIPNFNYKNNHCVEKFTLELCYDSYFDLIPEHYINNYNKIIIPCLAYYNKVLLLEVAKSKGCCINDATFSGALGGHIAVLDWCYGNNCNINEICSISIEKGHVHLLKWLQEHEFAFDNHSYWMCNRAVQYNNLEVLKFLRNIGCLWSKYTYKYGLDSGNQELIKWMEDNGCPTS